MNMLLFEEQARMNWYAYCVAGPNHRLIPPECVAEMSGRTPLRESSRTSSSRCASTRRASGASGPTTARSSRRGA